MEGMAMTALLIKNLPEDLHQRLKAQAKENRRSMAQEVLMLLGLGLAAPRKRKLPPLVKANVPITSRMIDSAKREGRA
jgi:plasmid stability protein